jgi:uncharacterized membrane-anchored protein
VFRASAVLCFWLAYILTRPLGAALGDLLAQPHANGGLGLGATATSAVFLSIIVGTVIVLSRTEQRHGVKYLGSGIALKKTPGRPKFS